MRRSTFRLDVTGHEGPPDTPRAADRILLLIFLPYLTALVSIIAAGKGMTRRQIAAAPRAGSDTDADIRRVTRPAAGRHPPYTSPRPSNGWTLARSLRPSSTG